MEVVYRCCTTPLQRRLLAQIIDHLSGKEAVELVRRKEGQDT